jgi:hypothetical protein
VDPRARALDDLAGLKPRGEDGGGQAVRRRAVAC